MADPLRTYPALPSLLNLDTCPYCGIAKPRLSLLTSRNINQTDKATSFLWHAYGCSACDGLVVTKWRAERPNNMLRFLLLAIYPMPRSSPQEVPEQVRRFLDQAYKSLHVPDGAILLANSAIDAMLKIKGLHDGSLYRRLEQAATDGILTKDMADWGHHVRLEANDSRHVDQEAGPPNGEQAQICVEFAETLAEVLFVLPARANRGIAKAEQAEAATARKAEGRQ